MSERKISKKSLENLKISNRESNRITKESLEISLLQLLEKQLFIEIMIQKKQFYKRFSNEQYKRLPINWNNSI